MAMFKFAVSAALLMPFGPTASAEEINLYIVLANNVSRTKSHYQVAVAEADRILRQCSGVSVKLADIVRMAGNTGRAAIASEQTRQAAMSDVMGYGGNILVVNDLQVCGPLTEQDGSNVIGCAGHKSAMTIETLDSAKIEGRAIAHELGHVVNLMWSITPGGAHSSDAGYLMFNSLNDRVTTPAVASEECVKFATTPARYKPRPSSPRPEALVLVDSGSSDAAFTVTQTTEEIDTVTLDMDNLLQQTWHGDFPRDVLNELMKDESSLPQLRAKVIAGETLTVRTNAARVLGDYGQPVDIDLLQSALKISSPHDDAAELQRFSASVISSITKLGITHRDERASDIILSILSQTVSGDAQALPVNGLSDIEQVDVMSSAATAALSAGNKLSDAGLINNPGAVLEDISGAIDVPSSSSWEQVIEKSPLNIDQNFLKNISKF